MSTVAGFIGSVLFTSFLFLSVPVYGTAAILLGTVSRRLSYGVAVAWSGSVLYLLKTLCGLRYLVEGTENLERDNCIVLVKHSSAWETIAQLKIFPRQTWVLKRELLWAPILGWVLRFYSPIAINRKAGRAAVEQVVAQGRERLERGYWVVIFPEGTRVASGKAGRYGLSGALLGIATGRPVIPVAHNAGAYWPRRGWLKRPGTIRLIIGEPIETAGRSPRELTDEVQQWIDTTVAGMLDV
ncbi:MAG TPA: lysophospholipid acyltransferase family protein [Gammaproteobacteria bacterium]|nr:lysophospholipid acyltransferase family protein [Gammaproteobacteria bacterium]